jgi:hypothetical protein
MGGADVEEPSAALDVAPRRRWAPVHIARAVAMGTVAGVLLGSGYFAVYALVLEVIRPYRSSLSEFGEAIAPGAVIGAPAGLIAGLIIGLVSLGWRGGEATRRRRAIVAGITVAVLAPLPALISAELVVDEDLGMVLANVAVLLVGPLVVAGMAGWMLTKRLLAA